MENQPKPTQPPIERPEWKWYYAFPFTRGRNDYKKDRDRYDEQFLTAIEKLRKKEMIMINGVSGLLIFIITTLWTLLPPLLNEMPKWLDWMRMGMHGFGHENWGNQIMLTVIPTVSGSVVHFSPNVIPNKKLKGVVNIIIKIVPVIILLVSTYLIFMEKKVVKVKQIDKYNADVQNQDFIAFKNGKKRHRKNKPMIDNLEEIL